MKKFLFLFISCFVVVVSMAQTEYLVTIDRETGIHTKLDSLPGIKWIMVLPEYTTFDAVQNRYFFRGADVDMISYLITVDAISGAILNQPLFPEFTGISNLIELRYDEASEQLYGLHWNDLEQKEYLVSLDETTGVFEIITEIPGVLGIAVGLTAFDQDNHQYIFTGSDNNETKLYSIDVTNGTIIYSPVSPVLESGDNLNSYIYDHVTGFIYALQWDSSEQLQYIAKIDRTNGTYQALFPITGIAGLALGTMAFDELNRVYTFQGYDALNNSLLYSIHVETGEVLYSPEFPQLANPQDNVIQLEYDRDSGNLYALHWEANTTVDVMINSMEQLNLFPNPSSGILQLDMPMAFKNARLDVYDTSMRLIKQFQVEGNQHNLLDLKVPSGVYIALLNSDNYPAAEYRLVVQEP